MRFFVNGPNIPDELLEERDNGNVVFFCGAGVSRPAGLPGFFDLAKQVMEKLGTPSEAKSCKLLNRADPDADFAPPLDQVFGLLQQEYGAGIIDDVVSQLLKTPRKANVEPHSIVLRLSRSADHKPQAVTTNFDLLFERADKSIERHVPPALPDIASGQPLEGVTYLHGRRAIRLTGGVARQGLVIGSADFGRAYLAAGWATKFVRDLLRHYIIVLLGYSAADPPVRYLLEGLHSRGENLSATIYAFDQGHEDEVQDRWRDRGVRALAYPKSDPPHSALWDSLRAWAKRADDPDAWRRSIVHLALGGPKKLRAHERGQVASLARTAHGAKLFADADPAPPAEWVCTFDMSVRYAEPRKLPGEEQEFDPLVHYGLDSDPPRPEPATKIVPAAEDFLSTLSHDEGIDDRKRLVGVAARWRDPLPPRLFHLARWLGNVLDDPGIAWWAAGYPTLHPGLLDQIEWQLERSGKKFDPLASRIWALLLEKFRYSVDDNHNWYEFMHKLKKEGWTNRMLRDFERVAQPYLKSKRPFYRRPCPPRAAWSDLRLHDLADFEVEFPARDTSAITISTENLLDVFRILRRGLERGSSILAEIETQHWQTATFHREDRPGERHLDDADVYLRWVVTLFDRLAIEHPNAARNEVRRWPADDRFFFNKLTIYAWMKSDLFSGEEVAAGLIALSNDGFWETSHRRELLHTLRARWGDISPIQRPQIEARIIAGRVPRDVEEESEYERRSAITAAEMLGWLEQQGCKLTEKTLDLLPKLRAADSRWQPSWDESADDSHEGRAGWVRTESDPSKIIAAPISELIPLARQHTAKPFLEFTEYKPFQGVVEQRPFRALAALSYEARQGRYPIEFWRTAISNWPQQTSERIRWLFARRIVRLPNSVISELRYDLPRWFKNHLPALAKSSLPDALNIWDGIIDHYLRAGTDITKSAMGDVLIGGEPQNRSRRTYDHAINSPIGQMADALFEILNGLKLKGSSGVPDEFRSRLGRLFQASGEGADHAISEIARNLRWLYYLDPHWIRIQVVPFFDLDDAYAEPAWNGYLHDDKLPGPELFALLKPHFLKLFKYVSGWHWDNGPVRRLDEFLVLACRWNQKDSRYVSFDEARAALQQADDRGRSHAAWFLARIVKEQRAWKSFGKPFIRNAWPREARFQTTSSSTQFAMIAEASGNNFPDVVQTILPLLVPGEHIDLFIHRMNEDESGEGSRPATKFPEPALALLDRLVPDDSRAAPYNLGLVLQMIANAAPHLRQDQRWRRLNDVVNRR